MISCCRLTWRPAKIELQANKKTINKLIHDSDHKDTENATLLSRLGKAWAELSEVHQTQAELESRIEEAGKELRVQAALSDERDQVEKEHEELRSKYELLLKEHVFGAESLASNKFIDGFDSFGDGMLMAVLVLMMAFGIYSVVAGKLT